MGSSPKVVIIGAGPTGLGAAYRLQELGHTDWVMLEANDYVGGLATSFTDEKGFTYDIGGHVMFSHYPYWDDLVEKLMGADYTELNREAWVWMENRFVPYPFQNNLRDLDAQTVFECVNGLIAAQRTEHVGEPQNFLDWINRVFGEGIAKHFMVPYNFKVWATPAELMNYLWIGERVSVVNTEAVLRNVLLRDDQKSWGPNNTFKYPLKHGTGAIWNGFLPFVEHGLRLNTRVASIDPVEKVVTTTEGERLEYDVLLNTMPLNHLVENMNSVPDAVKQAVPGLNWSGGHIVGVGIDREADTTKNWIYFPEPDVPFYRVTYLSNYSPYITPEPNQTLFLTETSFSDHKHEDSSTIVDRVIDGLIKTKLMTEEDRGLIATTWHHAPSMTYPVPSVTRDASLGVIQPWLRDQQIYSRGRFGAWLYEIGNMDHSVMQGVEFVNHVLFDEDEVTWIPRGEGGRGDKIH